MSGPVPSGPALAAPHLAGGAVVAQRAPLRIGYTPLGLHRHLPCLLRRLRQVEPGLRPRLVELTPAETLEALEQGRLDLGVVPQPACASPALRLLPLPAEPLLAALPAAEPGPVTLAGLARQGLVLFPPTQAPMLHARILQAFAAAGVALPPPREAKRASAVLALVAAGQGAALLPATAAQQRCPGVRLARIADGAGLPRMSMALALPRRRLDAPMQRLLALLPTL
ncbi:LysR family substrate-binding domain-containing protein [Roseomonas sp. 18066]|uniref:LysR family substrate-binding domain-containing protein n=1 Tax=Roseomonas sp. 18066 TaxID=2681412 RepID=UPI0013567AC4|nr:LysR family substrate-binding domain-containing protein [Roseomonas sp. 18066]